MNKTHSRDLPDAIATFISPNCADSSLYPSDIVDALDSLSEALYRLATVTESLISQIVKTERGQNVYRPSTREPKRKHPLPIKRRVNRATV